MRCVIILLLSALCACKAPSKKVYVYEQREIYSEQEVKSSCVGERINWQFISLDNIYNSDSQAVSSLLTRTLSSSKSRDKQGHAYYLMESKRFFFSQQ